MDWSHVDKPELIITTPNVHCTLYTYKIFSNLFRFLIEFELERVVVHNPNQKWK